MKKLSEGILCTLCGATVGAIMGISMVHFKINVFKLLLIIILQLVIFVIIHELSHGLIAEKNGLNFTVLYLGPFTFKRENKKFKLMKGVKCQLTYLGRAQIDNNEILSEEDVIYHTNSWIKAIKAGPTSDLCLSLICLGLAIILKLNMLAISTVIIGSIMCIPSYMLGDGKHAKMLKNDKVFRNLILYTYSIIGNYIISDKSKSYLINRIIKDIEETEITEKSIINLSAACQIIYQEFFNNRKICIPEQIDTIVEKSIEYKDLILSKQIEQTYFKGLINASIIYNVIFQSDIDKANILYNEVKNLKHNMPGEKLDLYRCEHVLGIKNREQELCDDSLMNPIFKGCEGAYNMEINLNKLILDFKKLESI